MTRLSVNVDHVATVREARKSPEPDPVAAAVLAELAGARGITIHLRGDRRHIQDRDLKALRETVKTQLNVEMSAEEEMVKIACEVRPDIVTFVPERPSELTTEGGLDVQLHSDKLRKYTNILHDAGLKVSLFVDCDSDQIKAAQRAGADMVELNTLHYAAAKEKKDFARELDRVTDSARAASKYGLVVAAGHDLDYRNVRRIAFIPEIEELNIGHALIARAVLTGMDRATREMLDAMGE